MNPTFWKVVTPPSSSLRGLHGDERSQALEVWVVSATAVIVSDMRMPGMDGLPESRSADGPEAVRILLTGRADLDRPSRP
jgi:CheY-like chemotaxis protein